VVRGPFRCRDVDEQLAEIGRVLGYPKIHRKLKWDEQRIEQFIRQLYSAPKSSICARLRLKSRAIPRTRRSSQRSSLPAPIALVSGGSRPARAAREVSDPDAAEFVRRL